jgi:hypothetical protein
MVLEDAVHKLWENKIYSQSGMGCTGPVVLVSEDDADNAKKILKESGFLS